MECLGVGRAGARRTLLCGQSPRDKVPPRSVVTGRVLPALDMHGHHSSGVALLSPCHGGRNQFREGRMSSRVKTQTRSDLEQQPRLTTHSAFRRSSVGMGHAAQLACSRCMAPCLGTCGANSESRDHHYSRQHFTSRGDPCPWAVPSLLLPPAPGGHSPASHSARQPPLSVSYPWSFSTWPLSLSMMP